MTNFPNDVVLHLVPRFSFYVYSLFHKTSSTNLNDFIKLSSGLRIRRYPSGSKCEAPLGIEGFEQQTNLCPFMQLYVPFGPLRAVGV